MKKSDTIRLYEIFYETQETPTPKVKYDKW